MVGVSSFVPSRARIRPAIMSAGELKPQELRALLEENGLVITRKISAAEVQRIINLAGLISMRQFETVQSGQPNPYELETVAKANGPGITQVSKPGPTNLHQDGYQFPA